MGRQVVILGPGLLGGSLALTLDQLGHTPTVWGRRQAPLDYLAKASPGIRVDTRLESALDGADFLVLATPIGVMPELLEKVADLGSLSPGATITDVGSVKAPIVRTATRLLRETPYHFVGSHPMAGSEASGVEAARASLFENAVCLLTPTAETDPGALKRTSHFWRALKARVHEMDPVEHDRIVAHVSHMPHALASIIVATALETEPDWAQFAGGGLQDTTRIASGEPAMWAEILLENREAVLEALGDAQTQLQTLIQIIAGGEITALQRFLLEAKELRDTHIVPHR